MKKLLLKGEQPNLLNDSKEQALPTTRKRGGQLFGNKLIPNIYPPKKKQKIPINPFLMHSPLRPSTSYIAQNEQAQAGFLAYLNGKLNEEELMYIRNFPTLYENLPEPKHKYLQMYIREAKGLTENENNISGFKDSQEDEDEYLDTNLILKPEPLTQKGVNRIGSKVGKEIDNQNSSINANETNQTNQALMSSIVDAFSNSQKNFNKKANESVSKSNQYCQNSSQNLILDTTQDKTIDNTQLSKSNRSEKRQKAVMFCEPTLQSNIKKTFSTMDTEVNSVSTDQTAPQKKSILFKRKSVVMEKVNIIQTQKMANLKSFLQLQKENAHKRIVKQNATNSLNRLRGVIKCNVALRKGGTELVDLSLKEQTMENTKFFSSLASIHSNYQQRIENKDLNSADSSHKFYLKGTQSNKSLRNLSIIRQQNLNGSKEKLNSLCNQISSCKTLEKKYFDENADEFVRTLQDPYDPRMRRKILKNDKQYGKFVQSYFQKVDLTKERETYQKTGSVTKQCNLKDQFKFEGRSFITLNREQIQKEKMFVSQIGDLDNFEDNYMINSIQNMGKVTKPTTEKKLSHSMMRLMKMKFIDNLRRKIQSASCERNNSKKRVGQNIHQENSDNNSVYQLQLSHSQKQGINLHQQSQQTLAPSLGQQSENQTIHSKSETLEQKMQKKFDIQQKNGYYLIKRNNNKQLLTDEDNDMIHDESDDSSNASRTEATLDVLYSESISIQQKLIQDNQDGLIKKLKQLIKLESIKKNVFSTNLYKLEHK